VSVTVVHSWEFCDESDQHSVFTAITSDIISQATFISTTNTLQHAPSAVYCIMLVFPHSF